MTDLKINPADDLSAARDLLKRARKLDPAEALPLFDEVVERFGESDDIDVQERVARALLDKGLTLDKLGRHASELQAYDELLRRYAGTDQQQTLEHVAWALYDKALALHNLDREADAAATYREVIERFRDAEADEIRPRVSWALWWLYSLGQYDKVDACTELVSRGDDELDPELRECVFFAYHTLAELADDGGQPSDALSILDTLLRRAGDATDPTEHVQVNNALVWKAYLLGRLGRHDEEVEVYDEVIQRLDEDGPIESAIDARRRRAVACDKAGRSDDALRGYDDTLLLLADAVEPPFREQAFQLLVSKGLTLRTLGRRDEALVVLGNAISAYRHLDAVTAGQARGVVVRVLIEKTQLLCDLGRSDEVGDVEAELIVLLSSIIPPVPAVPVVQPTESEVAELLAELHSGECWATFESPPEGAAAQFEAGAKALELYRRTDPLLQAPAEDWDGPLFAAGSLIRQVADGFALLSEPLGTTTPMLPHRRLIEWAIRLAGVDDWAAVLGHPLDLDESSEDIHDLLDEQPEPQDDLADDCAAWCLAALYQRTMLDALCDSQAGQDALHGRTLRWLAVRQLNTARSWGAWAFMHGDDAQPATAAGILIAQAYYRATRETLASSALTPSSETLREILRYADGLEWLANRDLVLPGWLDE
jgi:tetratricopeptide (TPR) repeat protein